MVDLKGELGDLLLQTVYHAAIGEEKGIFNLQSIADGVSEKMIARHPHVFDKKSADKQTQDWEKIKEEERKALNQNGTLDGVALGLPALTRAVKLQNRAARVGFDWPKVDSVLDKVSEEIIELTEAKNPKHQYEEFGDLMFVMAKPCQAFKD